MLETILVTASIALGGLVDLTVPGTLPASATRDNAAGPAIVHLVSRDATVTVRSGQNGLLYSLTGPGGKVLVADASAQQFRQSHPNEFRQLRMLIAVKADASEVSAADSRNTATPIAISNVE